jgi:uncharacterized membrane protein YgcG
MYAVIQLCTIMVHVSDVAHQVDGFFASSIIHNFQQPTARPNKAYTSKWSQTDDELVDVCHDACRYYKLNLRALYRHGTVEFRAAGGTQNPDKAAGFALLFLNLADASCRGIKARPPDQENVLKNMLEFIVEQSGCEKLHDWLCLRRLELKLDLDSEIGRAGGGGQGSSSSSSGGGDPASVGGGGRVVREHYSGCPCEFCRWVRSSGLVSRNPMTSDLMIIFFIVCVLRLLNAYYGWFT